MLVYLEVRWAYVRLNLDGLVRPDEASPAGINARENKPRGHDSSPLPSRQAAQPAL